MDSRLFSRGKLSELRARELKRMVEEVAQLTAEEIDRDEKPQEIHRRARLRPLVVHWDRAQGDIQESPSGAGQGPARRWVATRTVPYEGSSSLWLHNPQSFSTGGPPAGYLPSAYGRRVETEVVVLEVEVDPGTDGASIRSRLDELAELTQQWVEWLNTDVGVHNSEVDRRYAEALEARKGLLAALDAAKKEL